MRTAVRARKRVYVSHVPAVHRSAWKAPLHRIGVLRDRPACARTPRVSLHAYLHSSITVIRQNQQLLPVIQYFMARAISYVFFLAREM